LKMGVTTVRCMGVGCALRQAVEKGIFSGPRVLVAGPFERGVPSTGPVERRKWVRGKIEENVDFIKIASTGGVSHDGAEGMVGGVRVGPEALKGTVEEHRAVVEEAHDVGLTVAVHAEGLEGIKRAVEAGVDTVEHGMWLDDETAEKMAEKGIIFVPTLTIQRMLAEKGPVLGYVPASWSKTCKIAWPEKVTSALKSARKAGVKIACGTDGGDIKRMLCAEELELLVSMAGMTEMEAIVAATKISAEAIKRSKFIGTIEKGKHADIIVVDGDPIKNIKVLQDMEKIRMVMKDGKIEVDRGL
jgi:imidazolonepropionase-like amidohydrolase